MGTPASADTLLNAPQLPTGWTPTGDGGLAFDGVRALDCYAVLASDRIVIGDATGPVHEIGLEAPDHWGNYAAWVMHTLDERDGVGHGGVSFLPDGQRALFETLLGGLWELSLDGDEVWSTRIAAPPITTDSGLTQDIDELIAHMSGYLHLTDVDHIIAVLAAAVAHRLPYDPLWLMLIGASSGGKNEALRMLRVLRDDNMKDVTLPGLLGKGDMGLLSRLGNGCDALVTIEDFSALLADPTQSGPAKTDVFNAFRDIYDGDYSRDIWPKKLAWQGRISLVAACTPAIDQYAKHADALGTRWLNFRMVERDSAQRRLSASKALDRSNIGSKRDGAGTMANRIVLEAQERIRSIELPDSLHETILDDANLAAYGRAVVPRAWNGEVDSAAFPEEPSRITGQLRSLAIGSMALGVSDATTLRVVHRAAMSSMPAARALVLEALAGATEPVSQRWVRRATSLDARPCKRALEDWAALGFVSNLKDDDDTLSSEGWTLTPEYEHVVRAVYE